VAEAVVDAAAVVADELGTPVSTHPEMKNFTTRFTMTSLKRFFQSFIHCSWVLSLALSAPLVASAADIGKAFATPEEAVAALAAAASAKDTNALRVIFGTAAADLVNPDRVQAAIEFSEFTADLHQARRILRESDAKCVLEVGEKLWPFAIPIVKKEGQWFFDTEAGKEESLSRRIDRNELSTLQSVRAYVEAQREYAAKDRDGDEVLEYAQKIESTTGAKDGLYWPPDLDGEISPLGPRAAQAQAQGYWAKPREQGAAPEPFHGYFFKILTRQGKSAPLGKYDYIINGKMIAGFALVAWPADYNESGIMTFVVSHQGKVYQKDLGPHTSKIASAMKEYNPDKTWSVSVN
jgi:hypothetical protein